jgi:hypothetical protein
MTTKQNGGLTCLGTEPCLHVFHEGDWQVWLNPYRFGHPDGLCVGTGDTRDEAVANAVKTLEEMTALLQQPWPKSR